MVNHSSYLSPASPQLFWSDLADLKRAESAQLILPGVGWTASRSFFVLCEVGRYPPRVGGFTRRMFDPETCPTPYLKGQAVATSPISDKSLLEKVNQRLARSGSGSRSRVNATVCKGDVTLAGQLQYEIQRQPLLKAVGAVAGVRRVIDQLRVAPAAKKQQ